MSAADFADSAADLLSLGIFLVRHDMDARAIQIAHQVARIEPLRPEPYALGLKAAERLDDLEGIKWATLGVLRQAWPKAEAGIWKTALHAADATLLRLQAERQTKEKAAYRAALDEAVVRDCAAVVTWSGDAEVDLMVEEPSGSVCSFRSPRTTSGGVLTGDATLDALPRPRRAHIRRPMFARKASRARIASRCRRVWGKLTTGKVSVEVFTHYRAANQASLQKNIALENDEAMVAFKLDQGRRKDSLQQRQVANAVAGQMQVAANRQVLAQQIAAAVDPNVAAAMDAALRRPLHCSVRPRAGTTARGASPSSPSCRCSRGRWVTSP